MFRIDRMYISVQRLPVQLGTPCRLNLETYIYIDQFNLRCTLSYLNVTCAVTGVHVTCVQQFLPRMHIRLGCMYGGGVDHS